MKGTTVTLPPQPAPVPAKPASAAISKDSISPAAKTVATAEPNPPSKRPRWMLMAGAVLLFICCAFGFFALRRDGLTPGRAQAATLTAAAQIPSPREPKPTSPPPSPGAPSPQVPNEPTFTPAILESMKGVEQNPNDPYANLQLALAYWDAGQSRHAYETLNKAADLAGQDQAFFAQAAEEFAKREVWIAAAGMDQRAILSQPGDNVPAGLLNAYHEAVYKAAASSDLPLYLPFASISNVDQPMALIAEGRYNLFLGDTARAREFLERARRLKPTMPEVTLLDAEISFREGKKPEARQLLNRLIANLETPDWIRLFADQTLLQNP